MRVFKIAAFFRSQNQPVEVLPCELPIPEKHKALSVIKPEDILYVQKWRTDFNSVEHLAQYKGKCKLVFDIDDFDGDQKVKDLLDLSDVLVVGNHYLYNLYSNTKPTCLVPSAVDAHEYPAFKREGPLSISMAKCGMGAAVSRLAKIKDVLFDLREKYRFILVLAGFNDKEDEQRAKEMFPFAQCTHLRTYDRYLQFTVPLLQETTVGILPFSKRDEGKSGHSALANLAMGVPCCAAPYAECNHIIKDGVNGFIADTPEQWYVKIDALLSDSGLRARVREAGQRTIEEKYDVPVVAKLLLGYLRKI
jgi:glycosyltransferase involved in cell wall biosynthesis